MAQKTSPSDLDPKQEQLILSLLNSPTKQEAARRAGIPSRTMYRWLNDPVFRAAMLAARRDVFDDAMFLMEKNAVEAAKALIREIGEDRTESFSLIAAATRILACAVKSQDGMAVQEQFDNLRSIIDALKAGKDPSPPPPNQITMEQLVANQNEQAEASRLRVAWMVEIGSDPHYIEESLRYNRPESVAEEQYLLELVQKHLEWEKSCEAQMNAYLQ